MARTSGKKEKVVTPRELFLNSIGVALANEYLDADVIHLKISGTPEGVLVTRDGIDYLITVTTKKNQIEYTPDSKDVVRDFTAELNESEEETAAE